MFKMHEEKEAIKRIQTYLHFIRDRTHPELPMIGIDGIYGEETRKAVSAFQRLYGIKESGIVDLVTNDTVYIAFAQSDGVDIISVLSESDFPVSYGSYGTEVNALNYLLKELRGRYVDLPRPSEGAFFGRETEATVKALERIFGEEESGVVDARLYNRMINELDSLSGAKEIYE